MENLKSWTNNNFSNTFRPDTHSITWEQARTEHEMEWKKEWKISDMLWSALSRAGKKKISDNVTQSHLDTEQDNQQWAPNSSHIC